MLYKVKTAIPYLFYAVAFVFFCMLIGSLYFANERFANASAAGAMGFLVIGGFIHACISEW